MDINVMPFITYWIYFIYIRVTKMVYKLILKKEYEKFDKFSYR